MYDCLEKCFLKAMVHCCIPPFSIFLGVPFVDPISPSSMMIMMVLSTLATRTQHGPQSLDAMNLYVY